MSLYYHRSTKYSGLSQNRENSHNNNNNNLKRQLPCKTFSTCGACPYRDRCQYLHDPRLASPDARARTRKKSIITNNEQVQDSFFWPPLSPKLLKTRGGQPIVEQNYSILSYEEISASGQVYLKSRSPSSIDTSSYIDNNNTNININNNSNSSFIGSDAAVCSMWGHLAEYCQIVSYSDTVESISLANNEKLDDELNNYTGRKRLSTFIQLGKGETFFNEYKENNDKINNNDNVNYLNSTTTEFNATAGKFFPTELNFSFCNKENKEMIIDSIPTMFESKSLLNDNGSKIHRPSASFTPVRCITPPLPSKIHQNSPTSVFDLEDNINTNDGNKYNKPPGLSLEFPTMPDVGSVETPVKESYSYLASILSNTTTKNSSDFKVVRRSLSENDADKDSLYASVSSDSSDDELSVLPADFKLF